MNIGFRQYKLPFEMDMALNKDIINVNNVFIIDEAHPLSNIVDGRDDTYCQLQGDHNRARLRFIFASSREKPVYCNRMIFVFNKKMKYILIRDEYNNKVFEKTDNSKGFFKIEQDINKEFKQITIKFISFEDDEILKLESSFAQNIICPVFSKIYE